MRLILINRKKLFYTVLILFILFLIFNILSKKSQNVFKEFEPIYKGKEEEKKVAFACNVVWGNEYLPDMLRTLNKNGIKITFFFGGDWANKNKEFILSIDSDGHELANHGYNHLKPTQINDEKNIEEIIKTEKVIEGITGKKTQLFAPPYGDLNPNVTKLAESIGYKVIMWSVDTLNTKQQTL